MAWLTAELWTCVCDRSVYSSSTIAQWRSGCCFTLTHHWMIPSRTDRSLVCIQVKRCLYIFAGQRAKEYLNDFIMYYVDEKRIEVILDAAKKDGSYGGRVENPVASGISHIRNFLKDPSKRTSMLLLFMLIQNLWCVKWIRNEIHYCVSCQELLKPWPVWGHCRNVRLSVC